MSWSFLQMFKSHQKNYKSFKETKKIAKSKEQNKTSEMDPKKTDINEFPDKEFKITLMKMLKLKRT